MTVPPPPGPADPELPPDWFRQAQRAQAERELAQQAALTRARTTRSAPTGRPWVGSPPGAMFPAAEDATQLIQRITDEAVPHENGDEVDPPSAGEPDAGVAYRYDGATKAVSATTGISAAAGMKTATTSGVVRAGALMAIATVVSRVTGLLSKVAIVAIIGTGLTNSAYTVANTLPNIVFELLIGGVLTSVAIPLLTRAQRSDPDGGQEYTQRLMTIAVVGLLLATVVAVLSAPLLARLYVSSNSATNPNLPAQLELTTQLGRLLLPQIFFYGLAALFGAILNTKERFAANAWAPVLNNLVVIGVAGVLLVDSGGGSLTTSLPLRELLILGIGTTVGIVVQALVMIPSLIRSGFRFRWRWGWDKRLTEAGGLVGWALVYVLISQVGVVVTTRIAFATADSGPTIFSYASLLFQMPYGILGVAVLTAIMPRLSRHAAAGQMAAVKDDVSLANRLSAVALLPVSAALVVLGGSLATVLFLHGRASGDDVVQIGLTIGAMAIGLVPLAMTLVQMRVFYAMKDGRTPTIINGVMVAVRVPLLLASVLLRPEWVIPGLALSTAASYVVGAIVGEVWLRARFGPMGTTRTVVTIGKMVLASAFGGAAAFAAVRFTVGFQPAGLLEALEVLLIGGVVGLLVIAMAATALQVEELLPVRRRVLGLLGRRPALTAGTPDVASNGTSPPRMGGSTDRPATGSSQSSVSPQRSSISREQVTERVTHAGPGAGDDTTVSTEQGQPGATPPGGPVGGPMVELAPGATVGGRYRLVSLVAADDTGNRFWRAKDTVLPRDMAVTLLPDTTATSATVARTLRVGRLHHIGLPQTLDVGTEQGQSYVVGQWVDGATLTDLLAGGPLEPDVATSITAKVSEAVAEAHRNGIALGAINPALVRVNFDGQVRLSHVIAHGNATPDQDIRAVGGLLYLMLTGTWPFPVAHPAGTPDGGGSRPAQLTPAPTRLGREVPASEVRPGIPTALSALAERALHPDEPAGIHAVGAIAALLRQPEVSAPAPADDPEEAARPPLNPAERRLVRERRVKLGIATVMIAAFSALIIIVVASLAKQVMDQVAGPSLTGVQKLSAGPDPTPVPTRAATTAKTTAKPSPGATTATAATTTPPVTAAAVVQKIVNATAYDPAGDGVKDNTDQVPQAFDGNQQTFWATFLYKRQFPSFKPGVGITLEFANPIAPTSVTVFSDTPDTTVEIRAAAGPDLPYAQTTALAQGNIATGSNAIPGSVTIAVPNAPRSKYLVVFVVHMSTAGNRFRSDINEISVSGS